MACSIIRILTIEAPIKYGPIQVWSQEGTDVTSLCQYAWSTDTTCWTNWVDYATYQSQASSLESDFYLRVKLFGSFDKISINNLYTKCYSICLDNTNPFLKNFCSESIAFNPYANLDCAIQMQQQMADSIICMLGIPIYYFRVVPDANSADFNFKEYVFHNIDSVKYIKMMLQDGQMPSSKPMFSEMDWDWENDWEVELSKTQFASAFGDTAFPNQRDLIYVPMMKRMYEVNSAYDEKNEGLMWHSTTWKLALVKYTDKTNVDKGVFEDVIDTLTVNDYDDVLGNFENEEAVRQTGVTQTEQPVFAANNMTQVYFEDAIRKSITTDAIKIEPLQYNHRSNVVARNLYSRVSMSHDIPYITYQKKYCYDSFSFSIIINMMQRLKSDDEMNILTIGDFKLNLSQYLLYVDDKKDNGIKLEYGKSYIVWGIVDKASMGLVLNAAEFVINNRLGDNSKNYFDFTNAKSVMIRYNEDWNGVGREQEIYISPNKVGLSNFKLYNRPLDEKMFVKEIVKYTTNHQDCLINDLARPLNDGLGYNVR